ncbi:MAG: hypothetical protein AAF698_01690 [Pseudomonadota bacterium]
MVLSRLVACVLVACLVPTAASGGAWTRTKGDGVIISSLGMQGSPSTMFTLPSASDDKATTQLYVEYGLTDEITLGGSFFAETGIGQTGIDGSATLGGFVRRRLYHDDNGNVLSIQGGGAFPVDRIFGSTFEASTAENPSEIRLFGLGGTSWWGDWGSVFVSTAAGYAWRAEGVTDELRGEFVTGYKRHPCCLPILSIYGTQPLGDGEASLMIAPSFAWSPSADEEEIALAKEEGRDPIRRTTFQFGISYDVLDDGDGGFGFTLSLWRRF